MHRSFELVARGICPLFHLKVARLASGGCGVIEGGGV